MPNLRVGHVGQWGKFICSEALVAWRLKDGRVSDLFSCRIAAQSSFTFLFPPLRSKTSICQGLLEKQISYYRYLTSGLYGTRQVLHSQS
jgi:hypothetical protein